MAITLFIFFSVILILWERKINEGKRSFYLISGWFLKCVAGIAFVYTYSNYYGNDKLEGDSGAYFKESKILVDVFKKEPADYFSILLNKANSEVLIAENFKNIPNSRISSQKRIVNDTRNHIKTVSLFMLVFGENNKTIFVIYFFLSYLGFVALWVGLKEKVTLPPIYAFALLFLTPSLLFWTSSNLKEAPYILGLALVLAFIISGKKEFKQKVNFSIGLGLLLLFKPMILFVLFIGWLGFICFNLLYVKKNFIVGVIIILFSVLASWLSLPNKLLKTVSDQQFDFINLARGGMQLKGDSLFYYITSHNEKYITIVDSNVTLKKNIYAVSNLFGKIRNEKEVLLKPHQEKLTLIHYQKEGGSFFEIRPINNSWSSFIKIIPEAIMNTLLRPFPINANLNLISLFFFIENLFFIFLLFFSCYKMKSIQKSDLLLVWVCLFSIFVLAILIGMTTPASGAIVRYRIPIQLLIIIVFLTTNKKNESIF